MTLTAEGLTTDDVVETLPNHTEQRIRSCLKDMAKDGLIQRMGVRGSRGHVQVWATVRGVTVEPTGKKGRGFAKMSSYERMMKAADDVARAMGWKMLCRG